MEFKKSDPTVASLVRLCYPEYRGRRKVKVFSKQRYRVHDFWDGGSRDYVEFVHLPTGSLLSLAEIDFEGQDKANPFALDMGYANLTPDVAAVENTIFCGKDLGIRIYLHPNIYTKLENEGRL
jgi:hypothetical protein